MKKRLSYLFQSLFAITLFLGYSVTVNAATYTVNEFNAQIYDNLGSTLEAKNTIKESGYFISYSVGYTANSSGGAWGISSPIPILANHTYSMTVDPYVVGCGQIILSTYNRIGVGTSLSNAVTSYQNNTYVTEKYSKSVVSNRMFLQFVFTPSINASYIVFPYATSSSCSSAESNLSTVIIEDLGEGSITEDQINTSLTNQTNEINTSIENSTNTITGAITDTEDNINSNIDDMEDAIVESNKETQEIIKDQFNNCGSNLINKSQLTIGSINTTNGNNTNVNTRIRSDYIEIQKNIEYLYSINENYLIEYIFYYDNEFLGLMSVQSNTGKITFTNGNKIKLRIKNIGGTELTQDDINNLDLYFGSEEICSNKLDEANETSKGIWETLKSIPSLILDGIKGLFVPSQDELQSLIDEFKSTMETKLGAIYQVTDMLIEVFKSIFSPTNRNSCITFPEIKDPMFDKLIVEQTDYCFDSLRTDFDFLFTISDMIISIVCTLAFGNMLYKKFEGFIGGDTSDY